MSDTLKPPSAAPGLGPLLTMTEEMFDTGKTFVPVMQSAGAQKLWDRLLLKLTTEIDAQRQAVAALTQRIAELEATEKKTWFDESEENR